MGLRSACAVRWQYEHDECRTGIDGSCLLYAAPSLRYLLLSHCRAVHPVMLEGGMTRLPRLRGLDLNGCAAISCFSLCIQASYWVPKTPERLYRMGHSQCSVHMVAFCDSCLYCGAGASRARRIM